MHDLMHERQFGNRRRWQNERIEILVAHRPIEAIDREGEWQPGINDLLHTTRAIRVWVDFSRQRFITHHLGLNLDAKCAGHFERIESVWTTLQRVFSK